MAMGRALASLVVAASILAPAAIAWADDVVLLNNGGRVRGTVIEEDPAEGVRIRLADGTTRSLKANVVKQVLYADSPPPSARPAAHAAPAQVAAPPPGAGAIHVEAAGPPGMVSVDGGRVGSTPVDVRSAGVGQHLVHIDFDGGRSWQSMVLVQGGQTANIKLGAPERRSLGMMISGVVVTGVATVMLPVGLGLLFAHHSDCSPGFCVSGPLIDPWVPIGMMIASVPLAAAGISLWAVGAHTERSALSGQATPAWLGAVPRISVGLGHGEAHPMRSAALTWAF